MISVNAVHTWPATNLYQDWKIQQSGAENRYQRESVSAPGDRFGMSSGKNNNLKAYEIFHISKFFASINSFLANTVP